MFPFWPAETISSGTSAWLQGWSVIPAIVFWHHMTVLMLPGKLTVWRWTGILFGYVLAITAITIQTNTPFLFASEHGNPLYLNSLGAGIWYPLFGVGLIIVTAACVFNRYRSARVAQVSLVRKQLFIMAYATSVAGLTGVTTFISLAMGLPVPMAVVSLLLATAVIVIGLGTVRYNAFVQGRTMQHNFFANLLLISLVALIYWYACRILVAAYQAPEAIMVLILVLAIITHTLTLSAIRLTDWVFYHGETRQLRFNLRRLLRSAGKEGSIEANLGLALETLCNSLDATYGLIGIIDQGSLHWAAKCHWGIRNRSRSVVLLAGMALLVNAVAQLGPAFIDLPRWVHIGLIGALLLGGGLLGLFRRDQLISARRKFTADWRSWQP